MAKELILVPKVKYDNLLKTLETKNETYSSCTPTEGAPPIVQDDDVADSESFHSSDEETSDMFDAISKQNDVKKRFQNVKQKKLQTGKGLSVKSKTIGKPPGSSMKKRTKIKWLTY